MFCPRCGSEDEELYEGICRSCFVKEACILSIPQELDVTICTHCNSLLKGVRWEESELSEEELVNIVVMENYKTYPYVQDLGIIS